MCHQRLGSRCRRHLLTAGLLAGQRAANERRAISAARLCCQWLLCGFSRADSCRGVPHVTRVNWYQSQAVKAGRQLRGPSPHHAHQTLRYTVWETWMGASDVPPAVKVCTAVFCPVPHGLLLTIKAGCSKHASCKQQEECTSCAREDNRNTRCLLG